MTQILVTGNDHGRNSALMMALSLSTFVFRQHPGIVVAPRAELEPASEPAPLTQGALDSIEKARLKRERKNLKRLLTEKRDIIHRCGWCGYPVSEDGSFITGLIDPDHATTYLQVNSEAEEQLVNGHCCPNGDQL